ncbi:MAG TPA: sugar ABC transporter permease [Dongiaceae bacterium]|jgi:multiple sugar transport system permease protein
MIENRWMSSRAWFLPLPLLLIMALIIGWPFLRTIWTSFTDAKLLAATGNWVGITNYLNALSNPLVQSALIVTTKFVVISVSIEFILGVAAGLLLDQEFRGRTALRALMILPWALPTIVNATMWRLIYQPDFGALNSLLTQLGLLGSYRSWLGEPESALWAVCLADAWKNFPLVALICLAALQSVPGELKAAATIDGAGFWKKFRAVYLPFLAGPLTVAVVLRTIESFKVFDIIWVMTRGGPANSTKSLSVVVYQEAFSFQRAGSGASIALIVALISACLTALYVTTMRRQAEVR